MGSLFCSRDQLSQMTLLNIQTSPDSPTPDGDDLILSFFVDLPGGTMPPDLLATIFSLSPNVTSVPSSVNGTVSSNPELSMKENENLVSLPINPPADPTISVSPYQLMIKFNNHPSLTQVRYIYETITVKYNTNDLIRSVNLLVTNCQ